MSVGETAGVLGLIFAALCFGLFLTRFNVFALVVASILSAVSLMLYLVQDLTFAHAIMLSLGTAFVVQIGYLVGQFLKKPPG
jgi:predicted tellurium resistance membrane protein TerC